MNGIAKPYKVYIQNNIKIGVFGLGIQLTGLVNKSEYGETVWHHPIEIAQEMTRILKEDLKCDIIICLSHLGYKYTSSEMVSDVVLATQTKDIDLIIGGHTHTFLDKPTIVLNQDNKEVIINHAGCFGVRVGQIDLYLDEYKNKRTVSKVITV